MRTYKDTRGIPFHDGARERQLLDELHSANCGPLSREGLEALVHALLDLTRKEVIRGEPSDHAREMADAAASARYGTPSSKRAARSSSAASSPRTYRP